MNKEKNRNVKLRFCSASVVAMLSLSMLIAVMAPATADPVSYTHLRAHET